MKPATLEHQLVPRILYKYLPTKRIDVLERLEVRFTPPKDFNDPFEAFPRVGEVKRESVRRKLEDGEDLDELMDQVQPYFEAVGPEMAFNEVSSSFGALSLAAVADDPLLWAHYSDGHRGFAVGFDSSHPWFHTCDPPNPPLDEVQEVVYSEDRPRVTIGTNEDLTDTERRENALAMICTKHISWAYEKEWRLIRALAHADRVRPGGIHLFRFPPEAVAEVILGARIAAKDERRIVRALAKAGLSHARLRRAERSKETFRFELIDEGTA